jgi:Pectate lyase superfamily protein
MRFSSVRAPFFAALALTHAACASVAAPPAFTPSRVATPNIPGFSVEVAEFGAIPDDKVDDTQAIQRALDKVHAGGGGTLMFAKGQYDLSIDPQLRRALTIYPRMRWQGAGGAIIRLRDAQAIYESLLAPASYPTRLDDIEFIGMTFDANGLANPVRDPAETSADATAQTAFPTLRYVIRSFAGSRARISNCSFINTDNGNTLSFNGSAISDVTIERSQFLNVGGVLVDHDHSTIYCDGKRLRLANNEFRGRNGAGTLGARTAIETHGDDVEVSDNLVDGFLQGVNIVGRISDPSRQLIVRNQFLNVAVGLNIWPLADGLSGPAFDALVLQENRISIDADRWWRSPAMVVNHIAGIHFESDIARASITRLDVLDNQISFESFSGERPDADRFSAGIDIRGVEDVLPVSSLTIARNTVRNAIGPCMISAAIVGSEMPSVIADNTLIDCGRSKNLIGEDDVLRSGIVIAGKTTQLSITGNAISATGAEPTTLNGVVIASSCTEGCVLSENSMSGVETPVRTVGSGW